MCRLAPKGEAWSMFKLDSKRRHGLCLSWIERGGMVYVSVGWKEEAWSMFKLDRRGRHGLCLSWIEMIDMVYI